jgi:hypothetical protein
MPEQGHWHADLLWNINKASYCPNRYFLYTHEMVGSHAFGLSTATSTCLAQHLSLNVGFCKRHCVRYRPSVFALCHMCAEQWSCSSKLRANLACLVEFALNRVYLEQKLTEEEARAVEAATQGASASGASAWNQVQTLVKHPKYSDIFSNNQYHPFSWIEIQRGVNLHPSVALDTPVR